MISCGCSTIDKKTFGKISKVAPFSSSYGTLSAVIRLVLARAGEGGKGQGVLKFLIL